MARAARTKGQRFETDALLVRKVAFGEADLVATFFTEARGIVATVARGARRSTKRFSALEPVHLLRVAFDERPGAELATLTEANLSRARVGVTRSLDGLEAAGLALRWVRRALPLHTPEASLWHELNALLDALDLEPKGPRGYVAAFGLRLLSDVGWGLELERCASCGKPCAPTASAFVDASRGGLVCRACGGGPLVIRGARRQKLVAAAAGDDDALALPADADAAIELVEATLAAHAG